MTQMKFKKVPFDLELAKKITNKEVKGRIVTRDGRQVRIICFDRKNAVWSIIALALNNRDIEEVFEYQNNGCYNAIGEHEFDLHLEVPTYHKDYSNFKPCKWQPCLVRDYSSDTWRIEVCCGTDSNGVPIFYSRNNSDGYEDYKHFLPLSNITKRLIGTSKSYEDLIKELDAELTATTNNKE
jgi:hypothetical protein